ncbi:MAG TPA: TonB-dependent receptor [Gemmatimonadaceae bacterium]|nr:TonB-dependent receptor [Gemmatimonadaceae bacterium]
MQKRESDYAPPRSVGIPLVLALCLTAAAQARSQDTGPTGSVAGRVTSAQGAPLAGVQVTVAGTALGAVTHDSGQYVITRVPVGTQTIRARLIGFRPQTQSVSVTSGSRTTQNFSMVEDPLSLASVVVTGTATPRVNQEASVAISTLTPELIAQAAPRSTTEMLRYVPGFTRVESSGGEVNENITMRGILGVEYVMFMEDGLPVFPTMHTFFMNADNLFRPDENIEQMEVVRGGSSALYGSNTPGAIANFINKTGGPELHGSFKVSAATEGLARYDMNTNGPLGDDWRFNVGGFYRYDHGVRDPGFPGISGGQVKASITRLLPNGYFRMTGKYINDRNQFVLDLPFQNPGDPTFVPGFGDYGSMNTIEGNHIRVPTPNGQLELPLDNGLRTVAGWFTADLAFDLANGWRVQNAAQAMQNAQQWNAIVPSDVMPAADFVTRPVDQGGLGFPVGTTFSYTYTNRLDDTGRPMPFSTANGLVAPGGEWHVEKPISAFQDQFQVRKSLGQNNLSLGLYFANYSQTNRWYFTDILTDVADNPSFLDLVVNSGGKQVDITKNGFRHYVSNYVNGSGQATILSGSLGGEFKLTDRLRADVGGRWESNNFVQSSENTSLVDLDGNPATEYDNESWGNNTFRHFDKTMNDWAASLGLNFSLTKQLAIYALGSRSYKMPALDEFLNAQSPAQVDLFGSRQVQDVEGGFKFASPQFGATLNGFWMLLKNIVGQGAVTDTTTGRTTWIVVTSPENKSYGAELELSALPFKPLRLEGNATWLKAELGAGAGADIGSWINGVPPIIANTAATYSISSFHLTGDWHFVGRRFSDVKAGNVLPQYSYFNFGAGYTLPRSRLGISADLLNAFQSKGLEEGNPRLALIAGGRTSDLFLARPLLPRRFMISLRHDY